MQSQSYVASILADPAVEVQVHVGHAPVIQATTPQLRLDMRHCRLPIDWKPVPVLDENRR